MSVLNDVDRNATLGDFAEVQGSLYDRFFVLVDAIPLDELPSDSPGFGLTWIGEGHDWSGVGWTGTGASEAARWTTSICPSYFLSNHNKPGGGALSKCFLTNDPSELPIVRVVDQTRWDLRNELWLGGDVNFDGEITVADAMLIYQFLDE